MRDAFKYLTSLLFIAILLAWLAMLFEAIAWAGLDNLALPLVGHLLLRIYLSLSVDQLVERLAVTAGLGLLASVPLVARVLFPRLTARIRRTAGQLVGPPPITT